MHVNRTEPTDDIPSIAAFSHAVECIYDCALDPTRWPSAIREVCEAIRCIAGVIGVSDLITGSARLQQHWNYGPEWLERMAPGARVRLHRWLMGGEKFPRQTDEVR